MFFIVFYILAFAVALLDIMFNPFSRFISNVADFFLLYQLVINVGLSNLLFAFGNVFVKSKMLEWTGWQKSRYQTQTGFTQLGIGIAAVLCMWYGKDLWLGISIISICLYGGTVLIRFVDALRQKELSSAFFLSILPDLLLAVTLVLLTYLVF